MMLQAISRFVLTLALLMPAAVLAQTPLNPQQLEALVAPIALYPDGLLAEVLMASTYPTQVVQADRWVKDNQNLNADALKSAAEKQPWDDSVKALVATPSVLEMMSKQLDWTQKLGDAVVAQQPDVMDAIQRLRERAQANHKLESTPQQRVTVRQEGTRQHIAIEPTDPGTIYVPWYDPNVVYGAWPYPDYAPYYWGYPSYIGAGIIATGLAFGAGYALGRWASGNCCWRGNVDWNRNNINIGSGNRVTHWQSNRQQRLGNTNRGGNRQMDFRGRGGQQVLNPGNRGNAGNRGGNRQAGNRPTHHRQAGNRGGNRQAANRVRGGNRHATNRARGGNRHVANRSGGRHTASRGRGSLGGGGARMGGGRGGGARMGGSRGGGARMGGGGRGGGGRGGGGRGGGGRRSDIALKHDVVLLGRMSDGLGFYRFSYNGSSRIYVGVIAQEVQAVMPQAVTRDRDGYLRVFYEKLGVPFETYHRWIATGAHLPAGVAIH